MQRVPFIRCKRCFSSASSSQLRENDIENKIFARFLGNDKFPLPSNPEKLTFASVGISRNTAFEILESMFATRIAHNVTRRAALEGRSFYSIGPAGHEAIAAVAATLRVSDPALLHYRDTAFQLMRSIQDHNHRTPSSTIEDNSSSKNKNITLRLPDFALRQLLRSYVLSKHDKISGGRHKVLGDADLNIIPVTSTISAKFPRLVGLATSFPLLDKLKLPNRYPHDSIVIGSGGDAGVNHASFVTAMNCITYLHHGRKWKIPTLIIVSDNGIGISVPTPDGWVEMALSRLGLPYYKCNGANILDVFAKAKLAAAQARKGIPTFLHMECARLFNHAGSDAGNYMSTSQLDSHIRRDPLLSTIGLFVEEELATKMELYDLYKAIEASILKIFDEVCLEPKLSNLKEIMEPLIPSYIPTPPPPPPSASSSSSSGPQLILKQQIGRVLAETLETDPTSILAGEDIGDKGGNYGVTDGLKRKFGAARVRDTLLDETTIIGLGLGWSMNGLLPIVEICYLAYLHNAIDQVRGEGATLSFFSKGAYHNGMIIRISGGGLTEFGGHFHNENSFSGILDIPGILIIYPSNGSDYVKLFRTIRDVAKQGRVVIVLEPIKCYALKSFGAKNIPWTSAFPHPSERMELTDIVTYTSDCKRGRSQESNLAIVSYGNGVRLSLEAARLLDEKHNVKGITVFDRPVLRGSTNPLPELLKDFKYVLFADECRFQGCISADWIASLTVYNNKYKNNQQRIGLVTASDTFIPLGPAALVPDLYLSENKIIAEALHLLQID